MVEEERRRDVRARISLPVNIVCGCPAEATQMIDASFRGLFLRMKDPPPVRQLVKVRIRLPVREIELHGVVVRVVDDIDGKKGVGLRFFALNGQDRADWEAFIAKVLQGASSRAA